MCAQGYQKSPSVIRHFFQPGNRAVRDHHVVQLPSAKDVATKAAWGAGVVGFAVLGVYGTVGALTDSAAYDSWEWGHANCPAVVSNYRPGE
jgi:hypothetical protein